MFSYLRYFATISLVIVLIGAIGLGLYFRQIKSAELHDFTHQQNQSIVASFTETVWQRYASGLATDDAATKTSFLIDSKRFFQSFPLTAVTVFTGSKVHYSLNGNYVSATGTTRLSLPDIYYKKETPKGLSITELRKDVYVVNAGKSGEKKILMQSVVPMFAPTLDSASRARCLSGTAAPGCNPVAMVEIFSDVTQHWKQLQFQQYLITGTIMGAFIVLVGTMILMANRAEGIIARQHEVNLELTAAAAQAEAQSRDKSQFLASVSHELRTPLNAIIGFSEIIKNEARAQMQKVYQEYIDDIHASGRHLLSLINDILDYSKAEAGKLQMEWGETDATKVIRNSLRMMMPRAEDAQVTLIEDIPSHHLVITTDAKKLKQILLNLLSNAVKFTPAGGEVRCQAWEDVVAHTLVIQVRDTGIGIAPKDISRVMMPFGQVDSTLARRYEGTGLGLPLAKKFIESMGGEFGIWSEVNVGTTITITLPKQPKDWDGTQIKEGGHVAPAERSSETA